MSEFVKSSVLEMENFYPDATVDFDGSAAAKLRVSTKSKTGWFRKLLCVHLEFLSNISPLN